MLSAPDIEILLSACHANPFAVLGAAGLTEAACRDGEAPVLVVSNFTPTVHHGLRLGVPRAGRWRECINTDSGHYGGSNVGTPFGEAASVEVASHGWPQSIVLTVPPLATVMLQWDH